MTLGVRFTPTHLVYSAVYLLAYRTDQLNGIAEVYMAKSSRLTRLCCLKCLCPCLPHSNCAVMFFFQSEEPVFHTGLGL